MKIKLLDDNTINKIAAGEVIERPASALKELMENAYDGGATKIDVTFEEGGKNLIRVVDNGYGMTPEELPLALQRHATSKIQKVEDLFSLSTMGFRGEALASIASVSQLQLSSTAAGAQRGAKVTVQAGNIGPVIPAAPLPGTQVDVRDLFYNVPARQKFLKSTGGETAALKKNFKNFALIHPEITLSLKQDSRQIHFYPAQSFLKRSCDVLETLPSDAFHLLAEDNGFRMEAVLVHPKNNLATQGGIYIFVQGRPVQDKLISQAIMEGYRNLVMDHQFPQAVISLNVPAEFVDVNVHPAKLQVKFQQPSHVFRFVSHQIQKIFSEKLEKEMNPVSFGTSFFMDSSQQDLLHDKSVYYNQRSTPDENILMSLKALRVEDEDLIRHTPVVPASLGSAMGSNPTGTPAPGSTSISTTSPTTVTTPQANSAGAVTTAPTTANSTWSGLQVIGQLAHTYILTQSPKGLILIDQHAAHERVLFERLKNQNQIEKQSSLFDELIELEPEQVETLASEKWAETFEKLGFEFHSRGQTTLAVTAKPAFLTDVGLKPLIERLAEQLSEMGNHGALQEIIHDIWASMSCHGAIRAGKVMSHDEMKALLNQMEEYSFSSFCPHGRPVSVQISLYDLEKLFKRIV